MASNWLWDWLTEKNKALDEGYKNFTLKGNNIDRQLRLINRLDAQHDVDRGIKVHTIPRDTRSQLTTINKTDDESRTDLLEKTKPKGNTLNTNSGLQNLPNTNEKNTKANPVEIPK